MAAAKPKSSAAAPPAAAASSKTTPKAPTPKGSFPFSAVLVALLAAAVAAFAVLRPSEFQRAVDASKTRLLLALDGLQSIETAPASFDCAQAQQFLTDENPVKGFHVLCIVKSPQDTYVTTYTL